jgi:hypothetical protein
VIFGIWPGVVAADLVTLEPLDCPPEDTARTLAALRQLQGSALEFYVRAYRHFGAGPRLRPQGVPTPLRPQLYAGEGRMIDLVACYQSPVPDPAGFARFVRQAVRDVAAWGGGKVQVGEELNVPAPLDGGSPGCFEAVGAGVAAALDARGRHAAPVRVGVNVTETGWPTGDQRTEGTQAAVLTAVTDAVIASESGVRAYEWFGLRDGLTAADWTARFGVLRDDYTPKPAFAAIARLVTEHAAGA